jgi:ABC-type uncharacterized transport system involved in gliding motility auxiliary subunit
VREFLEELPRAPAARCVCGSSTRSLFSEDEDRAAEFGLQACKRTGGDSLYFGLAGTNSTDGRSAIPSFQADREEFLEYDVAKLIHELATPKKPVIGSEFSAHAGPVRSHDGPAWAIPGPSCPDGADSSRCSADPDADHIDKDVDVLMVVHPKQLPPKTLYAIDQFVMRGGKVLLFVDPNSGADQRPGSVQSHGGAMANHSSDLEPLLAAWGVVYDPTKVIGDMGLGLEVRTSMQAPPVRTSAFSVCIRDDMAPKGRGDQRLARVHQHGHAGLSERRAGCQDHLRTLLLSSTSAAPIPADRFNALTDPSSLRDGFKPTGKRTHPRGSRDPARSNRPSAGRARSGPAAGPPARRPRIWRSPRCRPTS